MNPTTGNHTTTEIRSVFFDQIKKLNKQTRDLDTMIQSPGYPLRKISKQSKRIKLSAQQIIDMC